MSDIREEVPSAQDKEQEILGQRLRDAREYLGLSQEFVAEQLSVPRASISAMETGKRKVSSLELKQLARLYKQTVEYFLGEEEMLPQGQPKDEALLALYRTTKDLSSEDRQQVLRFAQFLRASGPAPKVAEEQTASGS
jgi:transcriptional regulator with XRE-family HTH domain